MISLKYNGIKPNTFMKYERRAVYRLQSIQSPSTISKELLVQTENFFIGHLSSVDEAYALSKLQVAYSGIENDILKARTPGFMRMLTMSNRFVIPVQTELYNPNKEN